MTAYLYKYILLMYILYLTHKVSAGWLVEKKHNIGCIALPVAILYGPFGWKKQYWTSLAEKIEIFQLKTTRLIVIDIALLTVIFCSLPCFVLARLLICNCPLLKDISFSTEYLFWCDKPVTTFFVRTILG